MKGEKTGGRKKGTQNKLTGAHGDLLAAWDKEAGPKTARDLMRSALEDAKGRKSDIVDRKGNHYEITIKDWDPIKAILPYIARRMPDVLETPDLKDAARMVLIFPESKKDEAGK